MEAIQSLLGVRRLWLDVAQLFDWQSGDLTLRSQPCSFMALFIHLISPNFPSHISRVSSLYYLRSLLLHMTLPTSMNPWSRNYSKDLGWKGGPGCDLELDSKSPEITCFGFEKAQPNLRDMDTGVVWFPVSDTLRHSIGGAEKPKLQLCQQKATPDVPDQLINSLISRKPVIRRRKLIN